jgi:Tol biopolymer transport system component
MPLEAGDRLGHYEVLGSLGAGGMGEVYRARDTGLDRDVAIKVLPENVAQDEARLARFEREAKLLASLNHPNIATLYGLEEHEQQRFLVMELVEGETLSARLDRARLPVDEALQIARQIAHGLEAAHRQGVIHRDLKPANVMISAEGTVKILDFGLAKAWHADGSDADLTHSPTLTAQMTGAGVLLGTAPYMSPEQARGQPVDRRADVWAFGCILYEMLTGRRLFEGDTVSDVLAGVLKSDIDFDAVPRGVPPPIRRLLSRCLQRDPGHRLRDLGDALLELEDQEPLETEPTPRRPVVQGLAWTIAGAATLIAVLLAWRLASTPDRRQVLYSEIGPPAGTEFVFHGDLGSPPVISPDGSNVVFGASRPGETVTLWVRSLRTGTVRQLPGTEGGFAPFWSPDGRSIGFFDLQSLKRINVADGASLTLCPTRVARGGAWTETDDIVFALDYNTGLSRVPATGGEPTTVTTPIQGRHTSHRWPVLVPDGRRLVYLAINHASPQSRENELRIVALDGSGDRALVPSLANAAVAGGHLFFTRDRALMSQTLDAGAGALTGDPHIIAPEIFLDADTWRAVFSAVGEALLYQPSSDSHGAILTVYDLEGREVGTIGGPGDFGSGSLDASPDGRRVAITSGSPSDIYVVDIGSGERIRLTFGPASATSPVWSADGSEIFYRSFDAEHPSRILAKPSSGAGDPRVVLDDPELLCHPADVSPDGRFLVLEDAFYATGADIWVMDLDGSRPPRPLIARPGTQTQASVSPDGLWIAYTSDDAGSLVPYVEPFVPYAVDEGGARRSGRWQVSEMVEGGILRWGSDGRTLFDVNLDRRLFVFDIDSSGASFRILGQRVIAQTNAMSGFRSFDHIPGTDKLLVLNQPAHVRTPLTMVAGLGGLLAEADR